ncbi:hypothetical protein [Mucilaginibacter auburnensis]|uniref:Uncharacterized protein n=1 Tax=Mucilaginibacter auburnensis TaxID=1457233 RepID=A0A2H9VNN3_9SPHI|nr:hypothetical protein [Mucilaginibacter auburnensis]PJJ79959.1 hypothetical protein CLV57_3098 [Mucilaginibacter auburnensis]
MPIIANIQLDERYENHGNDRYADAYINLYDSETGQPVNGNNVEVTYQIDEFSEGALNSYVNTITISGQSQQIATNFPTFRVAVDEYGNSSIQFYRNYFIVNVSETPNPAPPVYACNLQILGIDVDKFETTPGAADGQITVKAYSSYLPIKYSLDNVNFQTSNVFTGLSGGLKTVYVTDANTLGCSASQDIAVPTLNNLLLDDPSVTVGGNICRWNAAFNPIVFTYQRRDFSVYSVSYDSITGYAALLLNTNDTSKLLKNDKVYVNAGAYKGVFNVIRADGSTVVIEAYFTTSATGFINIDKLRPYYAIRTKIVYQDATTGQQKTIESINRPDNTGLVKADLSSFLQSLVKPVDESDYALVNYRDANLSASYSISYAPQYDDANGQEIVSPYYDMQHPFYVVYAAKQLGDRFGGNMAAYVPFKTLTGGAQPAKWLTDFAEPAYSKSYPFDIGFIYSEDILGLDLYCEMELLDVNRKPLPGGTQAVALLNEDGSWLLNQDGTKYIIAGQMASTTALAAQLGLNRLLINNNFPPNAQYFSLTIKYDDSNNVSHAVTQTQVVRIDKTIDDNSVYLRWIGLNGSWNYYRFVYNQEVTLDVQNAVIIKKYVSDWENQQGIEDVISKSAEQKMKVMAEDLSVNDIKGLQSIKYSPKVQMLVNKNPVKWQTVILNTATFAEYETRNGQAPFSITFNLPAINIQTQ